ncbi:hypothetical protein REPUB_Repub15cG0003500 [Reevesia pubescens]
METMIKELKDALRFAFSVDFWRMAVFWTISLFTSYFQLHCQRLFSRKAQSYPRCHPPISESLRPATSGLGAAAAHALSREGFYVVLVARSSHLLSKITTEIKTQNEDARVKAFEVDLSSFQSILEFKGSLQQWLLDCKMHSSIQLLINNAVFDVQVDRESVSGTRFLRSEQYPFARIYEYSKLYLLLFSYELYQQLDLMYKPCHVSVNAADPGFVETNIMREVPRCLSYLAFQVLKLLGLSQSPENGVSSILDAALAPPEASGVNFFGGDGRSVNSSVLSHNAKLVKELWTMSYNLLLEASLASKEMSSSISGNFSHNEVKKMTKKCEVGFQKEPSN